LKTDKSTVSNRKQDRHPSLLAELQQKMSVTDTSCTNQKIWNKTMDH